MSIATVAKKDFQDSARSRWLWALSVLFVLFVAGLSYLFTSTPLLGGVGQEDVTTVALLIALSGPSGFLVPIIGIMISYKSIVGERESGTLKILLSLPHTRRDAILGKLLGRSLSLSIAILVGFAVGLVVFVIQVSELNLAAYVSFLLLTLFFGIVYISIGVGLSSVTASASRALALAVGFIVLFEFLWGFIPFVIRFVINGFEVPNLAEQPPEWSQFLGSLAPGTSYSRAANAVLPDTQQLTGGAAGQAGSDPFFLQNEFGLVILLAWLVVPIAIGYLRFDGADLS
jgi:ABC-2 type transport system permease protein